MTLNIPRRRLAEAKALVRFALSAAVPAVEDADDYGDDTDPLPA